MRAILLTRVSDESQKQAMSGQTFRIQTYGDKNKMKVIKEFEFDESAWKKTRKEFSEVMKLLKEQAKESDPIALCCDKIDRLIRNFTKDLSTLEELRAAGKIELHFPSDNLVIHKHSPASDLFRFSVGVSLAKYYSDCIRDNVKRRFDQKLRDGEWCGKAPIGYLNKDIDDEHKTVIVDENRVLLIKKVFELYATGNYSLSQLMKIINDDGLRNNTKAGKPITKSQLSDILANPFYYGEMIYDGKIYPHKYPPIIDKWLYEKCKSIRVDRHGTVIKYASKPFVFRGLIKCAECGCMVGKDPKKGINYCVCNQFKGNHKAQRVTEEDLIEQVRAGFRALRIPKDVLEDLQQDLNKVYKSEQSFYTNSVQEARKNYDKIGGMIDNAYMDKLEGNITLERYESVVNKLKAKQSDLNAQMQDHNEADRQFLITSSYLFELANKAEELFVNSEVGQKRQLVNFVLSNLSLDGKKLVWKYKKPFDMMALCTKSSNWLPELDSNQQPFR